MSKLKSYHHGDLRNALIKAGLEIVANEGASALSLRKVARKVGVSHTAPYRHFHDKESLIAAIAQDGFRNLAQRMKAYIDELPDESVEVRSRFEDVALVYVQFALENPDHLRVMFGWSFENQHPALRDAAKNTFNVLVHAIQVLQAKGYIVSGDPVQLALGGWSMVHGVAMLLIENKIPPAILKASTKEQIARSSIQVLYNGLGNK